MKFTFADTLETLESITDSVVKGVALIFCTGIPVAIGFYVLAEWSLDHFYEMDPGTKARIERACEGKLNSVQIGAFNYDCSLVHAGADPIDW